MQCTRRRYSSQHLQARSFGLLKLNQYFYTADMMRLTLLERRRGCDGFDEAAVIAELEGVKATPLRVSKCDPTTTSIL